MQQRMPKLTKFLLYNEFPSQSIPIRIRINALTRIHIAFRADSRAQVDAFYRAALGAGGKDNGPPGPRPHYHEHYYGAFVLDPDGYNIEAVIHTPE